MTFLQRLKTNTKEKFAVRFFTALFLTCFLVSLLVLPVRFNSSVYFSSVKTALFLPVFAGFFLLLSSVFTVIDSLKTERLLLLLSYLAYGSLCVMSTDNTWFGLGACLVFLVICVYVFRGDGAPALKKDIHKGVLISAAALSGIYFALFVGAQTLCRYLTQSTPNYDFAIFAQMFYNMKTSLQPLVTCERDVLMSHFGVHISPIFYLFLPVYAIFPKPGTLMICQAVLLASGVIPVCMIAKKLGLSNKAAAVFAFLYALYPALAGGCFYDLHENKFLAPLLLWLFYFMIKKKWYGIAVFSVLTLAVKEDAALYVAFAGIYAIFAGDRRDKITGGCMVAGSVGWFILAAHLLSKYGEGTMDYRFGNFMSGQDDGLLSVVVNVIKDPAFVIHEMFDATVDRSAETKPEFIIRMLMPLGCLPVITKKLSRYILLLPMVLINLMPDYVYQHSIYFQYAYGSLAFLMFAAMLNYADLGQTQKRTLAVFASVCALFFSMQTIWQRADYVSMYAEGKDHYDEVRQAIYEIPEDASVGATTFYCSTASQHKYVYDLKYSNHKDDPDYIILDMRSSEGRSQVVYYDSSPDYDEYRYIEGYLIIYKRVTAN